LVSGEGKFHFPLGRKKFFNLETSSFFFLDNFLIVFVWKCLYLLTCPMSTTLPSRSTSGSPLTQGPSSSRFGTWSSSDFVNKNSFEHKKISSSTGNSIHSFTEPGKNCWLKMTIRWIELRKKGHFLPSCYLMVSFILLKFSFWESMNTVYWVFGKCFWYLPMSSNLVASFQSEFKGGLTLHKWSLYQIR